MSVDNSPSVPPSRNEDTPAFSGEGDERKSPEEERVSLAAERALPEACEAPTNVGVVTDKV